MLDARGVQVWVFSGQDWLVRDPDGPYVPLEERTVGFRPTIVEDFGAALDVAAKIVGVSKDFELLARCERDVRAALADSASVARSQPYYLDITHPLANKGVALSEIAKLLGVPLAEIAVIGDGGNDVAMFERSGLSIAMGNASPQVQQAADFVTDSNSEDGFANAIERFILGGNRSNARVRGSASRRSRMIEPARAASKISLVLADVDGTLVTAEKVLTPRAGAAVKALHAAGIAFAITSGRPPRGMAMLIDPLALRTPVAGFNGGIFVKPDMTIMEEHVLAADVAKHARRGHPPANGMDVWVYSGKDWLVRDPKAPHVAREQWTVKFAPTVVENFEDVLGRAVKIVGVSDDLDLVARCEKDAQDALGANASAARSQPYYLDVTHPDANKGTVVTTLSKLLVGPAQRDCHDRRHAERRADVSQ